MNDLLIKCRTCDSQNYQEYFSAEVLDQDQEKSNDLFLYYRCNDCGSIFLHPVPNNLSFYYGQNYSPYVIKHSRKKIEHQNSCFENAKLKIVKQYVSSGQLIEVGPSVGRFLSVANQAGYNVLGIEQDDECVKHIRNVLNLDAICSNNPAEKLLQMTNCCDIIVAWHVIEHLQDLRGFVSAASKSLRKPNGVIIVSAPNPATWSFKIFKQNWVHLDAPRHLTLIPLHALDDLMATHGLERIVCIFDDAVGLSLSTCGWQGSMKNLSRNKMIQWPLLSGVRRIVSMAMSLFDKGNGAAYTAVYKINRELEMGSDFLL